LIENMAYFTPTDMPEKKYYIFGKGHGEGFANAIGIPLIGQIPIVEQISASGDAGSPIALDEESPVAIAFMEVARKVKELVKNLSK